MKNYHRITAPGGKVEIRTPVQIIAPRASFPCGVKAVTPMHLFNSKLMESQHLPLLSDGEAAYPQKPYYREIKVKPCSLSNSLELHLRPCRSDKPRAEICTSSRLYRMRHPHPSEVSDTLSPSPLRSPFGRCGMLSASSFPFRGSQGR